MTTKEKFLKDIKEVMDKYYVKFSFERISGVPIPYGPINNIQNYSINAFKVEVPNEGMFVCISGKEFIDYMCDESK